jgi:monovalent cation:H+ antiporter-2, CPA2 family
LAADVERLSAELNPQVVAWGERSHFGLAGANAVYSGEGEVALTFIEDTLDNLGATPEQIDRERERARRELFGEA